MDKKDIEQRVIEQYQQDEEVMILVFAQWCINNELDPLAVYAQAYPGQKQNDALLKAIDQTVSKEEADPIADDTLLQILQLFGNDDLAFVVVEISESKKR